MEVIIFLSRVEINTKRKATMKFLSSLQVMHASVENCFTEDNTRKLWRLDYFKNAYYVLILSANKPDLSVIKEQYGFQEQVANDVMDYERVLDLLQNGQVWRFRLRANPVHSVKKGQNPEFSRGKVYPHITVEQQKNWLLERSEKLGFSIKNFDIVQREVKKFKRQDKFVTLSMATYEGILEVEDVDAFRKTLTAGVGKAKAYGCGLLTLARIR